MSTARRHSRSGGWKRPSYTGQVLRGAAYKAIATGAGRVPGLRALPILKLLVVGEIALLARSHILRLDPAERRRLIELLRAGRLRPSHLSPPAREELETLIAKAEPRLFAGLALEKLSPVRLPRRVVRGPKRRD